MVKIAATKKPIKSKIKIRFLLDREVSKPSRISLAASLTRLADIDFKPREYAANRA